VASDKSMKFHRFDPTDMTTRVQVQLLLLGCF
jgi:hypothetical protein